MTSQYMTTPKNLCKIANKLLEKENYQEAASKYLNAIMLDRNNAKAYYNLGLCYKHLEKYDKAINYLEKSTEIKPEYDTYFELGVCYLLKGIPCAAIKNFVCAIKMKPDSPDAILQLGISHELCEEYDMALMIYQKLIENSPKYLKAYDHKSSLLMKMDRYKEASGVLNKIMKLDSTYSKAYVGIGICFDKLGKKTDAQRYYRKYLSNVTEPSQTDFVLSRMKKLREQKSSEMKLALV